MSVKTTIAYGATYLVPKDTDNARARDIITRAFAESLVGLEEQAAEFDSLAVDWNSLEVDIDRDAVRTLTSVEDEVVAVHFTLQVDGRFS